MKTKILLSLAIMNLHAGPDLEKRLEEMEKETEREVQKLTPDQRQKNAEKTKEFEKKIKWIEKHWTATPALERAIGNRDKNVQRAVVDIMTERATFQLLPEEVKKNIPKEVQLEIDKQALIRLSAVLPDLNLTQLEKVFKRLLKIKPAELFTVPPMP